MVGFLRLVGRDPRRSPSSSWTAARRRTDPIVGERRLIEARIERQARAIANLVRSERIIEDYRAASAAVRAAGERMVDETRRAHDGHA